MGITRGTACFGAFHKQLAVSMFINCCLTHWLKEARPAGAGIKFGVRRKQWRTTTDAGKLPGLFFVVQRVAERPLGSPFAGNVKLLRAQLFTPLRIGFGDFGFAHGYFPIHTTELLPQNPRLNVTVDRHHVDKAGFVAAIVNEVFHTFNRKNLPHEAEE